MVSNRRMARIRMFFQTVRFVVIWLVRAFRFILWTCLMMVASLWTGIPESTERIAEEWTARAVFTGGVPTKHTRYLHYSLKALAAVLIVFCWLCFAFTTVFLVMLIF